MPLPASFRQFTVPPKGKHKGILIGSEGRANSGKSRFALTAPGPGIFLAIDRQYRAMLDSLDKDGVDYSDWLVLPVPNDMPGTVTQAVALGHFKNYYTNYYLKALANPDARTVVVDGDSDTFEWQMLALYGRTTQIPMLSRTPLNADRRVMIAKAVDSGKIVITTNKVKKLFEKQFDDAGNPIPDPQKPGEQLALFKGDYQRAGFNDYEYCYELQIQHLFDEERQKWGVKILMCKVNRSLEGHELWGDECNLWTLLEYVYPDVPLSEWGY